MHLVAGFVGLLLWTYAAALTIRLVLSWIPILVRDWQPRTPLRVVAEVSAALTNPPLRFLRGFLRPVRVGTVGIDLAFVVLYASVVATAGWLW